MRSPVNPRAKAQTEHTEQEAARNNGEVRTLYPLTKREIEVFRFLLRCADVGIEPSLRDVARRTGGCWQRVHQIVQRLHRKGWLRSPSTGGIYCGHLPAAPRDPE